MTVYKFIRRQYPSGKKFWSDIYRNNICIGAAISCHSENNIWLDNCPAKLGLGGIHAISFIDFVKKAEASNAFNHAYDYWDGAYHYYFNPDEGYKHVQNHAECFPIVEKVTIIF